MTFREVEITSIGDMVLDVTASSGTDKNKAQFIVASQVLCIASPVFRAMLEPGFREGHNWREAKKNGSKYVLELPDEESIEAMEIILNAIHLRFSKVPVGGVALPLLLKLAVVCDKYQIYSAISNLASHWVVEPTMVEEGAMDWLFVSWVFRRKDIFKRVTKAMILISTPAMAGTMWSAAFAVATGGSSLFRELCSMAASQSTNSLPNYPFDKHKISERIPEAVLKAIVNERALSLANILGACRVAYERYAHGARACIHTPSPESQVCDNLMRGALYQLFCNGHLLGPRDTRPSWRNGNIIELVAVLRKLPTQINKQVRPNSRSCVHKNSAIPRYSSLSPVYGNKYCKTHGAEEDCFGPFAHKECNFVVPLLKNVETAYAAIHGLELSLFKSRK